MHPTTVHLVDGRSSQRSNSLPVVMHVIDSLDISGGSERQLVANLRAFDHSSIQHRVAVLKDSANSRAEDLSTVVPLSTLFERNEHLSRPAAIRRLLTHVRNHRPALIHASLPNAALASRIVGPLTKIPVAESLVNISHEPVRTVDNPYVTRSKLKAHIVLDKLTMQPMAGYHAVSEAVKESWVRVVGLHENRVHVIPRGVEVSELEVSEDERRTNRESVRMEFGIPLDSFIVLSVGRVEPQKGHRYLVEAIARLARSIPHLYVMIVGRRGLASPQVEQAIDQLELRSRVKLAGPRRDLARILSASDAFVFPSLFEGNGGNAMIEAMAAGLPIVTTGEAPMTDMIPDESVGLLVPRASPELLADAIAKLIDKDNLRTSLGAAAKNRALGFPNSTDVARQFESWYRDLLGLKAV